MAWIRRHGQMLAVITVAVVAWCVVFALKLPGVLEPLDHWQENLRAYALQDAAAPPPDDAVLFLGSSSIRMWQSLRHDFPRYRVFRRGLDGSRLRDTARLAGRLVHPYDPEMVVVYAGENDLAAGHSPDRVLADFHRLVKVLRSDRADRPVVLLSIKPSPVRWHLIRRIRETNHRLRAWCETDPNLTFVDVHSGMINERGLPRRRLFEPDGLHLSRTGYLHWADSIRPHLPPSALRSNALPRPDPDAFTMEAALLSGSSGPAAGDGTGAPRGD